jgi:hypothetical protein
MQPALACETREEPTTHFGGAKLAPGRPTIAPTNASSASQTTRSNRVKLSVLWPVVALPEPWTFGV